jgi:hypothetical protein
MLTSGDYRQLAERCALLASECTIPGIVEELRMLAARRSSALGIVEAISHGSRLRLDWLAGHVRFELANRSARYPIEVRWQFRLRSAQLRPGRLFAFELLAPILQL